MSGPTYGERCPGCGIWTEQREGGVCWTVDCPAFKLFPASLEAKRRARESPGFLAAVSAGRLNRDLAGIAALRMSPLDAGTRQQYRDGQAAEQRELAQRQQEQRYAALDHVTDADSALRWLADHRVVNIHA